MSKKSDKKRTTILFLKNVPANIKAQYKAYCAKREISMTDDIIEHMKKVSTTAEKGTGLRI